MTPVRILLVDDSNVDVVLFKNALTSWNRPYDLTVAVDGKEAVELVEGYSEQSRPGIIVIDLNLPKIRGIDVLKTIRENALFKSTPVIIFSSADRPDEIKKAYELKVTASIKKPLDFEEFKSVVYSLQDLLV